MITINGRKIETVTKVACELVSQQTLEDVQAITEHAGKMYAEGQLAAEIAVKLMLRLLGITTDTRTVSPVDALVDQAEAHYLENYAG